MRRRSFLRGLLALVGAAAAPGALRRPEVAESHLLAHPVYLSQSMSQAYLDAGYVYVPYIPIQQTEVLVDDLHKRRGLATHYGKVRINQDFYVTRQV